MDANAAAAAIVQGDPARAWPERPGPAARLVPGVDLLAAVVVTSLRRKRLKHRTWRAVHWAGYAAWPIAYLHGLGAGTDAATSWMLGVDVACPSTIGAALGWRLSGPSSMAGWPSPPKSSSSSTAAS